MAENDPYLIKRYANRKLYDSARRRFTTLDEIAALLESGRRIAVRDHDGGVDRTDEVLAQVLRRRAKSRPGSSNFFADLMRAPVGVAQNVVGLSGARIGSPDESGPTVAADEPSPEAPSAAESEIRELREQVSHLTDAVTLLLEERIGGAAAAEAAG
ncbi:polyhydroxyalkanoate synthesis regulator DNA-binding domain-containing protein [Tsukamurella soli]|uniref:PHA accumulation regulator DNA-binding N-terminal domain-containing protein n=1 Tax=Tsukamurella soli TaxID=644556 RepID=A0ABP8J4W3_9ACTN